MSTGHPTKQAFLDTWPGGYRENFEVYSMTSGKSEEELVSKCLTPFLNAEHTALEIGCGGGYWPENYLVPGFKRVIGIDLLPECPFKHPNFFYTEAGNQDYACGWVGDASVDFVWSFGVFCHLPLEAIAEYVASAFRVLKPGGRAVLYFSNDDRRPGVSGDSTADGGIMWCRNDVKTSMKLMKDAGFTGITDLFPELHDTMLTGVKE